MRPGTASTSPMSSSGSGGSPNASASSSRRQATISRHTPRLPDELRVTTAGRSPAKACSSTGAGALVVRSRATPGGMGPAIGSWSTAADGNVVQGEHHTLQPAVLSRPPGRSQERAVEGPGRRIGVPGHLGDHDAGVTGRLDLSPPLSHVAGQLGNGDRPVAVQVG